MNLSIKSESYLIILLNPFRAQESRSHTCPTFVHLGYIFIDHVEVSVFYTAMRPGWVHSNLSEHTLVDTQAYGQTFAHSHPKHPRRFPREN